MADDRRTIPGILTYIVLTFALSSFFYRAIIRQGSLQGSLQSMLLVWGLMWCPGVSGLLTRLAYQRTLRGVGWGWGRWKYQWASYWIPIVYASAVYLPLWAAGYGDFHAPVLEQIASRFHAVHPPQAVIVAGYVVVAGTLGMITGCIGTAGEELGWRGFLVPELAKTTSFPKVALISGCVWAAWHVPLIVGADYHGAGPVWYSILCFVVLVLGVSFLFAWMRLKSGSVWTGMLLHTSHNLFVQRIFDPLTRRVPLTGYLTGEFGAGLAIAAVVIAFIFWRKRAELPA